MCPAMKKSLCANWFQRQGECQSLPTKNFYSKPERMVGNQAMLIHVLKHLFLPLSSTQPMVSDFFFFSCHWAFSFLYHLCLEHSSSPTILFLPRVHTALPPLVNLIFPSLGRSSRVSYSGEVWLLYNPYHSASICLMSFSPARL